MIKPFSLQPLMHLAQHQNDAATRKLGELTRQQQTAEQKLETLREYRKEYQTRMQEASGNGLDQANLRNFQQFIDKLDMAITQQAKAVEQSKNLTQIGRGEFDTTQRKLKSFDTLQQRHLQLERQDAEKTEQKNLDEHTGRLAARSMIDKQE
ncbi:MAG: flagellar export protein FliJ [Gallionella sp.]|nr:flagellar export protein FliJ [Gallionella sp.]